MTAAAAAGPPVRVTAVDADPRRPGAVRIGLDGRPWGAVALEVVERLRRAESEEGVELTRTIKEGSGLSRLEVEEPVPPEVFAQLWPLTEGRRLRKRRHRIPDGDLTWEIDEFLDRDLALAEVELSDPSVEAAVPEWLMPYVEREVTEDDAYSNVHLAS